MLVPSKETMPNVLADSRRSLKNLIAILGLAELLKESPTTSVSDIRMITCCAPLSNIPVYGFPGSAINFAFATIPYWWTSLFLFPGISSPVVSKDS